MPYILQNYQVNLTISIKAFKLHVKKKKSYLFDIKTLQKSGRPLNTLLK